jgi:hypothetical protein
MNLKLFFCPKLYFVFSNVIAHMFSWKKSCYRSSMPDEPNYHVEQRNWLYFFWIPIKTRLPPEQSSSREGDWLHGFRKTQNRIASVISYMVNLQLMHILQYTSIDFSPLLYSRKPKTRSIFWFICVEDYMQFTAWKIYQKKSWHYFSDRIYSPGQNYKTTYLRAIIC